VSDVDVDCAFLSIISPLFKPKLLVAAIVAIPKTQIIFMRTLCIQAFIFGPVV